jgi:arylsulfatase A-like enzyme
MIARWDGVWGRAKREREIVELTDLMPTLLDAAGIELPAKMDGQSNAALFAGADFRGRGHAYVESYAGGPEDPTRGPAVWAKTIRTDRWRATFYPDASHGELFDLESDPGEFENRWNDSACREVRAEHQRMLLTRMMLMDHV